MDELRISVETTPTREDIAVLEAGLTAHTLPIIGVPGFRPLAVFLRDSAGHIVAGAYGRTNWNWLHISTVWVAEGERGKGFGRELILAIEAAAAQRGRRQAHLDTFSYQARPFYERLGYRVFGELEDYPLATHGSFCVSNSKRASRHARPSPEGDEPPS